MSVVSRTKNDQEGAEFRMFQMKLYVIDRHISNNPVYQETLLKQRQRIVTKLHEWTDKRIKALNENVDNQE